MIIRRWWDYRYTGPRFCRWVAFKLPKAVVYHATIRLVAHVSTEEFRTTDVSLIAAMEAVRSYESTFPKYLR